MLVTALTGCNCKARELYIITGNQRPSVTFLTKNPSGQSFYGWGDLMARTPRAGWPVDLFLWMDGGPRTIRELARASALHWHVKCTHITAVGWGGAPRCACE